MNTLTQAHLDVLGAMEQEPQLLHRIIDTLKEREELDQFGEGQEILFNVLEIVDNLIELGYATVLVILLTHRVYGNVVPFNAFAITERGRQLLINQAMQAVALWVTKLNWVHFLNGLGASDGLLLSLRNTSGHTRLVCMNHFAAALALP